MKMVFRIVLQVCFTLFLAVGAFAEGDVEGSKDPSFLTRMPYYIINVYEEKDFDS